MTQVGFEQAGGQADRSSGPLAKGRKLDRRGSRRVSFVGFKEVWGRWTIVMLTGDEKVEDLWSKLVDL